MSIHPSKAYRVWELPENHSTRVVYAAFMFYLRPRTPRGHVQRKRLEEYRQRREDLWNELMRRCSGAIK